MSPPRARARAYARAPAPLPLPLPLRTPLPLPLQPPLPPPRPLAPPRPPRALLHGAGRVVPSTACDDTDERADDAVQHVSDVPGQRADETPCLGSAKSHEGLTRGAEGDGVLIRATGTALIA